MKSQKETIRLERTFDASIEDVWDLWTTREGIESWWGPDGFRVEVIELDLRPRGQLYYAMMATAEPQIAFMKQAGMPLTTKTRITYTEVRHHHRLAYVNHVDFVPGVAPYENATSVDFMRTANGVRMVLTLDPMHDEIWTQRMAAGWESEVGKLEKVLVSRGKRNPMSPMFKKVAFTMYPVEDTNRARRFYEGTLGLTVGQHSSHGIWTEYDLPGGGCLALFKTNDIKPSAGAGGSIAFEVEDLDALVARLKSEGVSFKAEMVPSPVCRMAIVLDSEGNSVILHELARGLAK
jgi:uncharacterized protein YndB with AHSA1/START domain/predicted enzyme related to lactoylglutathione lyase